MDDITSRPTRREQVIRAIERREPEQIPGWPSGRRWAVVWAC